MFMGACDASWWAKLTRGRKHPICITNTGYFVKVEKLKGFAISAQQSHLI